MNLAIINVQLDMINPDTLGVIARCLDTRGKAAMSAVSAAWRAVLAPILAEIPRTLLDLVRAHPAAGWDRIDLAHNESIPFEHAVKFHPAPYRDDIPADYIAAHLDLFEPHVVASHAPIGIALSTGSNYIVYNPEFTPDILRANRHLDVNLGACKNEGFDETNYEEFKDKYRGKIMHINKFSREFILDHANLVPPLRGRDMKNTTSACFVRAPSNRTKNNDVKNISIDEFLAAGVPPGILCGRADFTAEHIMRHLSELGGCHTLLSVNPNIPPLAIEKLLQSGYMMCNNGAVPQEFRIIGGVRYAGINTTLDFVLKNQPETWWPHELTQYLGTVENIRAHPELDWDIRHFSSLVDFKVVYNNPDFPWNMPGLSENETIPVWYIHDTIDAGWDFRVLSGCPK